MKIKHLIIPIIITILIAATFVFYGYACLTSPIPMSLKIIVAVILLFFLGVAICSLVERIKELRSGEYDDISKY